MMGEPVGKVIAITGAGDGLGRALARRCAREGDTVILLGRTKAKVDAVAAELGAPHFAVQCDVCDPESVRAAFAVIAERHPKLDVLINNAGVFEPFTLANADPVKVKQMMETNLAGPVYCAHEALPLLRNGGHIINVTTESMSLKMPMLWMYAGSKAGLEFISEMWMRELEPEGVRVTIARCGQMMDETKTGSTWAPEVSMQFGMENAKVGIHMRERGISHYNSVTDGFRAIIDSPRDVHMNLVWMSSRPVTA
jgi:NAD(P)-dependent dehydrogenase (short-subunit alcohol dehydrogenase family)